MQIRLDSLIQPKMAHTRKRVCQIPTDQYKFQFEDSEVLLTVDDPGVGDRAILGLLPRVVAWLWSVLLVLLLHFGCVDVLPHLYSNRESNFLS